MTDAKLIVNLLSEIIEKEGNNIFFKRVCNYLNSIKEFNKISLFEEYFKSNIFLKWAVNILPYFPVNGDEFMILKDKFDLYFIDNPYDEIKYVIPKGILFRTFTKKQMDEFLRIITKRDDSGKRVYKSINNFSDMIPYLSTEQRFLWTNNKKTGIQKV